MSNAAAMEVLPNIPRLYTALAEWLACILYILALKKRFSLPVTAGIAAVFLVVQALFLDETGNVPLAWWLPCMLVAVLLMYLLLWSCCDIRPTVAGYYCARAFILAEFAASLVWQVCCLLLPVDRGVWLSSVCIMLAGYALILFCMWQMQKRNKNIAVSISGHTLLSAVLMALLVFTVSNMGFVRGGNTLGGTTAYGTFYVRTLVDFAGLLILMIQQRQLYEAELRLELEARDNILNRQYEQYKQSRENIRLLNRRYHDLKVQIANIRAERDPGKQAAYLAEMETGIRQFEAENKTGNAVLDTVLTTKSLYCTQHDINMTIVADGKLIGFMSTMEICTVFGMALDGAIEQVNTLPEEQRLIRVAVYAQNGFVMLRFENYCGDPLPDTTADYEREQQSRLESLRRVAEKYSGSVTAHTEDGWYYLRVLLVPKN